MTQKKSPYCNKDDPPPPRLHTQTIIRKNPQETKGRKQQNNKERIGSDINNNIKTCPPPPPQSERNPKQCWICGSLLYSTFLNDSYLRWVNHFRFVKFARLGGGGCFLTGIDFSWSTSRTLERNCDVRLLWNLRTVLVQTWTWTPDMILTRV